jgi:signal transduction histidine kinase
MNKRISLVLGALAILLLGGLLYAARFTSAPGLVPTRFTSAEFCRQSSEDTRYDREGFAQLMAQGQPTDERCWRPVALPDHAEPQHVGLLRESPKLFQGWWRVRYTVPAHLPAGEALMVHVPRIMGASWQLLVDGQPVANNLDDWRMTWNTPVAVHLDPLRVRPGHTLDIRLGVIKRAKYGASIAPISVGTAASLMPALSHRQLLQITIPQASAIMLALMGCFYFAFWLARPIERTHLLLAMACLGWCVANLQFVLHRPDHPVLANAFSSIVNISVCWVVWLVYLFVLRIDERHRMRWLERALPWYVAVMTLAPIPAWPRVDDIAVVYHVFNAVVGISLCAVVSWLAWQRGGRIEMRAISLALMFTMAAAAHDVPLLAQRIDPEHIYLLPYGTLVLFSSLLYAVQRRYVAAINETERLSASLAERLAQREAELHTQHERLLQIEREQALLLERQRLMRDMHDGLGSALTSSLVLVEQGQMQVKDIANVLRECVDDLRLVIDSLEPIERDLVALLATLRYRLGKRMEHAGLKLEWAVNDLPALHWLDPSNALQVLRIVQEALTNILKHAQARKVRIETLVAHKPGMPDQVCVCIEDDGVGFDEALIHGGRGLRSLRLRAQKLQGELAIQSTPGRGTRVCLYLPVSLATPLRAAA